MQSWHQQASKSEQELKAFIDGLYVDGMRAVMGIKLGTLWYRWVKPEKGPAYWDFNHLEDGHCPNSVPTPKHPSHNQVWKGGKWAKAFIQLKSGPGGRNVVEHYIS